MAATWPWGWAEMTSKSSERGRSATGGALEEGAQGVGLFEGEGVGEVGEGTFFGAAVGAAVGLAQEDGGMGAAIGDDIDVHGNKYEE